jgi:hypothetical protein
MRVKQKRLLQLAAGNPLDKRGARVADSDFAVAQGALLNLLLSQSLPPRIIASIRSPIKIN